MYKTIKRDSGTMIPVLEIYVIVFMLMVIFLFLELRRVEYLSDSITDTLTDGLLAAATLDEFELRYYGMTGQTVIFYPENGYQKFRRVLKEELELDDNFNYVRNEMIDGKVTVHEYIVYSVENDTVTVYRFDDNGATGVASVYPGGVGILEAPNGKTIENTSFYVKVGFNITYAGNQTQYVYKTQMVDIAKNN